MQLRIGIGSIGLISNDMVVAVKGLIEKAPTSYKLVSVGVARAEELDDARAFAKKHGLTDAKVYTYQELVKDPKVDLVYIALINPLHYSAAKLMLENYKHCLIEKPLTLSVEDSQELFEIAAKNGCLIQEALFSQFVPAYVKIRELIKAGEIGDLVHVQANFCMSTNKTRLVRRKYGGGCLYDVGNYALNAIFNGVGWIKPTGMKAFGRKFDGEACPPDKTVTAIFEFPNQVTASMLVTAEAAEDNLMPLNHIDFIGTKGNIIIRDFNINNPQQIIVNGTPVDTCTDDGQASRYLWPESTGLRYQVEDVRTSLMEGRKMSRIHGKEQSILLIQTLTQLMDQIGYNVKGVTPRDYEFKQI